MPGVLVAVAFWFLGRGIDGHREEPDRDDWHPAATGDASQASRAATAETREGRAQTPESTTPPLASAEPVVSKNSREPLDEATLMARLRSLGETAPLLSLQLARDGNARAPQSLDAPERAWFIVKSLVNLQRFEDARAEARTMVDAYRDTPFALDVERHLLVHPAGDTP